MWHYHMIRFEHSKLKDKKDKNMMDLVVLGNENKNLRKRKQNILKNGHWLVISRNYDISENESNNKQEKFSLQKLDCNNRDIEFIKIEIL